MSRPRSLDHDWVARLYLAGHTVNQVVDGTTTCVPAELRYLPEAVA